MDPFWSWQLLAAMALGAVVQCLTIGAYASRIAGALSGRVATAISLFNVFATAGRFASMLYTPILGSLSDQAGRAFGSSAHPLQMFAHFEWQLRWIVFAGAVGTAMGTLLLPTFLALYMKGIASYERFRSIPKSLLRMLRPRTAASVLRSVRLASPSALSRLSMKHIPREALVLNTLVTSIYGAGVVGAVYASVLSPGVARTALLSSGLINGFATVAYNIVVDPSSAFITDQAVRGERSLNDIKSMIALLGITATLGFILSQLLLVPVALAVVAVAHAIGGR